jgi:hypothetical protein
LRSPMAMSALIAVTGASTSIPRPPRPPKLGSARYRPRFP